MDIRFVTLYYQMNINFVVVYDKSKAISDAEELMSLNVIKFH
jgi:hypothetical protein